MRRRYIKKKRKKRIYGKGFGSIVFKRLGDILYKTRDRRWG